MKTLALLIAFAAHAEMKEPAIVKTFNKASGIYKKFHGDTMKYRSETESYNEKEFEPAVEAMISLLGDGKCKTCVRPYLNGLSNLEGSASETLTEQLQKVISGHSKELEMACKGLSKKTRKALSVRFRDAIGFSAEEQKVPREGIEKNISKCL